MKDFGKFWRNVIYWIPSRNFQTASRRRWEREAHCFQVYINCAVMHLFLTFDSLQSIGGERQKVSIARALLKDPTLILCDEVTSAVDAFAERDIVNSLRQVEIWSLFLPHQIYFHRIANLLM